MDAMSDMELTKRCADAEGIEVTLYKAGEPASMYSCWLTRDENGPWREYAPLHDDAQALALLKRFPECLHDLVTAYHNQEQPDYNRTICLCVAAIARASAARRERRWTQMIGLT